jgi:hypothetical protein
MVMDFDREATFAWQGGGPPSPWESTEAGVMWATEDPRLAGARAILAAECSRKAVPTILLTRAKFKKDVNLEGTNSTSPLKSIKTSKNELKTNSKRTPNEVEKPAYNTRNRPNNANAMQGEARGRICFW